MEREELATQSYVLRRARPSLVVLDADFRIVSADGSAERFLGDAPRAAEDCLPAGWEQEVRRVAERFRGQDEATLFVDPNLILHLVRLHGPSGSCYALTMERYRERNPLEIAKRRYALSSRETEVLRLILSGMTARDISCALFISVATVQEYFKRLSSKTGAANRAEMVARILEWASQEPS